MWSADKRGFDKSKKKTLNGNDLYKDWHVRRQQLTVMTVVSLSPVGVISMQGAFPHEDVVSIDLSGRFLLLFIIRCNQ